MTAEILEALVAANLAAGGAILLMLAAGKLLRRLFGARLAYAAWLIVPLASVASLLPARQIPAPPPAPAPGPVAQAAISAVEAGPSIDWAMLALVLWAAGAAILLARTWWIQRRALRLIGRLTPEGELLRAANTSIGPAVLGILRPRIMLPSDFERRFEPLERTVILAHEQRHIAAGDQRINTLLELARCLCWFNPLVHLAARGIRIDQELACDAAVIARFPDQRRTYAQALLKSQTVGAPLPLGCYWPERSAHSLKERLTMLTFKAPSPARKTAGAAVLALLGLGAGFAAWAAAPEPIEPPQATSRAIPVGAAPTAVKAAPAPKPRPSPPRRAARASTRIQALHETLAPPGIVEPAIAAASLGSVQEGPDFILQDDIQTEDREGRQDVRTVMRTVRCNLPAGPDAEPCREVAFGSTGGLGPPLTWQAPPSGTQVFFIRRVRPAPEAP